MSVRLAEYNPPVTSSPDIGLSAPLYTARLGLDLAVFGAAELAHSGPAAPNEIGFSRARNRWGI
jgi:hypothetical protein